MGAVSFNKPQLLIGGDKEGESRLALNKIISKKHNSLKQEKNTTIKLRGRGKKDVDA